MRRRRMFTFKRTRLWAVKMNRGSREKSKLLHLSSSHLSFWIRRVGLLSHRLRVKGSFRKLVSRWVMSILIWWWTTALFMKNLPACSCLSMEKIQRLTIPKRVIKCLISSKTTKKENRRMMKKSRKTTKRVFGKKWQTSIGWWKKSLPLPTMIRWLKKRTITSITLWCKLNSNWIWILGSLFILSK